MNCDICKEPTVKFNSAKSKIEISVPILDTKGEATGIVCRMTIKSVDKECFVICPNCYRKRFGKKLVKIIEAPN